MFRFRKLRNFYRDVRNYIYLWQVIRKNRGTADWQRFNLRTDWVGRIYTVFNPNPEDKGDEPYVLEVKMGEKMIPCHKYIDSIGLGEVVGAAGEKIPDTDSYLVVYYPLFAYITTWRMIINTFFAILILIFHKDIITFFKWIF